MLVIYPHSVPANEHIKRDPQAFRFRGLNRDLGHPLSPRTSRNLRNSPMLSEWVEGYQPRRPRRKRFDRSSKG